jgi:hypothetical protein
MDILGQDSLADLPAFKECNVKQWLSQHFLLLCKANVAAQVFDMFVDLLQNTVCQKCGDRGYPEALNYCVKCKVVAEHT